MGEHDAAMWGQAVSQAEYGKADVIRVGRATLLAAAGELRLRRREHNVLMDYIDCLTLAPADQGAAPALWRQARAVAHEVDAHLAVGE